MRSLGLAGVVLSLVSGTRVGVVVPAPVTALGADGARVAYASSDCRVRMWDRRARTVVAFGRGPSCVATSTGTGISAVSVAGRRALWLHYTGGNIREWSLWTATPTNRRPRELQLVTAEPEDPAPIVVGEGDASRFGALLPYAVRDTVVGLRSSGARAFTWTAPGRVTALAARDGELGVAADGGTVSVLDARGRLLRTESFGRTLDAVRITGRSLVAQSGRTLEVRGGGSAKVYTLTAGLHLSDAEGGLAVLVGAGKVRLLNLDTGAVGAVASGSYAQLEQPWLVYASGRRVGVRRL